MCKRLLVLMCTGSVVAAACYIEWRWYSYIQWSITSGRIRHNVTTSAQTVAGVEWLHVGNSHSGTFCKRKYFSL